MAKTKRKTIRDIQHLQSHKPITCLTAYSHPMAQILDEYCDIILVGDSLAMVLYGMDNTLGATLDMMSNHAKAVVKGSNNAVIVVDMPFGTYQQSSEKAFANAAELITISGANAIKIEGGAEMAQTVDFLSKRGIAVMGHIGLKPQSVNISGYRYQGRSAQEKQQILDDALALESAGAFAIVLEGIAESLAKEITATLKIPTIGIGASPNCNGQILVTDDMLGMFGDNVPKFVKTYANISQIIKQSVADYTAEVENKQFPELKHCFEIKKTT